MVQISVIYLSHRFFTLLLFSLYFQNIDSTFDKQIKIAHSIGILGDRMTLLNDEIKRNGGRPIFNISVCLSFSSMVLIRYIQCTHTTVLRHTSTVPTGNHMRRGVKCRLNLLSVFEFLNRHRYLCKNQLSVFFIFSGLICSLCWISNGYIILFTFIIP